MTQLYLYQATKESFRKYTVVAENAIGLMAQEVGLIEGEYNGHMMHLSLLLGIWPSVF